MNTVRLRDITPADLPILFEHQREPEANQMAAFPPRDWPAFQAHWAMILDNERLLKQAIIAEGELVGHIVGYGQAGERQVGYWIAQAHWGEGIATRALTLFLEVERTRPLYAHVAHHNVASRRVLEKCGFVVCGESSWAAEPDGEPLLEWVLVIKSPD